MFSLPTATPHDLKKQLDDLNNKPKLWQLAKLTGRSEGYISTRLRGHNPMPASLKKQLEHIVAKCQKTESGHQQPVIKAE